MGLHPRIPGWWATGVGVGWGWASEGGDVWALGAFCTPCGPWEAMHRRANGVLGGWLRAATLQALLHPTAPSPRPCRPRPAAAPKATVVVSEEALALYKRARSGVALDNLAPGGWRCLVVLECSCGLDTLVPGGRRWLSWGLSSTGGGSLPSLNERPP